MPWKIRRIDLHNQAVQLYDKNAAVFMDVELSDPPEVHLFIGDEDPEKSNIYVVVDTEGVHIERAQDYGHLDVTIIDNILKTMGYDIKEREKVHELRKALGQRPRSRVRYRRSTRQHSQ